MRTFDGWTSWDEAREDLSGRINPDVLDRLGEVYAFAAERHAGQTRPAGQAYVDHLADASPPVLTLKLADRLSNVQNLDTHPRPAKQATYYAETVSYIVPLAATLPWFADWFDEWKQHYAYLKT
jgi:(p)ppGpp synthase/HD superfamily hydrolase